MANRRLGSNTSLVQKKADEVLRAASSLPSLIGSLRTLDDIHPHYKDVSTLAYSLGSHVTDTGVMRQLLLHTDLPRQMCRCLAKLLQYLAAVEDQNIADDPALAILGQLAGAISTLFGSPAFFGDAVIDAAISAAVQDSGLLEAICAACPVLAALLHPPDKQQQQQRQPASISCAVLAAHGVLMVFMLFVTTQLRRGDEGKEFLAATTGLPVAGLLMAVVRAYPAGSVSGSSSSSSSRGRSRRCAGMTLLFTGFVDGGGVRMHMGTLAAQVAGLKRSVSGDDISAAAQQVMYALCQAVMPMLIDDILQGMKWVPKVMRSPPAAVQDLVVMLFVHMAWTAQQQHEQRSRRAAAARGSRQAQQQQQPLVPAWHEQFLAAVGAGPWDPAGFAFPPDFEFPMDDMQGSIWAMNLLLTVAEAHGKGLALQGQTAKTLLAGASASSSSSSASRAAGGGGSSYKASSGSSSSIGGDSSSSSSSRSFSSTPTAQRQQQQQGIGRALVGELQSALPCPEVLLLLLEMMLLGTGSVWHKDVDFHTSMRFRSLLQSSASSSSPEATAAIAAALAQPVLHHLGPSLLQTAAGSSNSRSSSGGSGAVLAAAGSLNAADDRSTFYRTMVEQLLLTGYDYDKTVLAACWQHPELTCKALELAARSWAVDDADALEPDFSIHIMAAASGVWTAAQQQQPPSRQLQRDQRHRRRQQQQQRTAQQPQEQAQLARHVFALAVSALKLAAVLHQQGSEEPSTGSTSQVISNTDIARAAATCTVLKALKAATALGSSAGSAQQAKQGAGDAAASSSSSSSCAEGAESAGGVSMLALLLAGRCLLFAPRLLPSASMCATGADGVPRTVDASAGTTPSVRAGTDEDIVADPVGESAAAAAGQTEADQGPAATAAGTLSYAAQEGQTRLEAAAAPGVAGPSAAAAAGGEEGTGSLAAAGAGLAATGAPASVGQELQDALHNVAWSAVSSMLMEWSSAVSWLGSALPAVELPGGPGSQQACAAARQQLLQLQGRLQQDLQDAVNAVDNCHSSSSAASAGAGKGDTDSSSDTATGTMSDQLPQADDSRELNAALSGLAQPMAAFGEALCAQFPLPHCCNNPGCVELRGASELQLVGGKGSVCSRCRTARYCCRQCQLDHLKAHRPVCKRVAGQSG